jgi:TolB-like protein
MGDEPPPDSSPPAVASPAPDDTPHHPTPHHGRADRWRLRGLLIGEIIAGIGAIGAVLTGVEHALHLWSGSEGPALAAAPPAHAALLTPAASMVQNAGEDNMSASSLVVLPFDNDNPDHAQQWFVDAVTRDLTSELSQLEGSFVIDWSSARRLRKADLDTREIGARFSVRYLVTGSVGRDANGITVTASLVEARTGRELWSERFNAEGGDVASIENTITSRIAFATRTHLLQVASQRSAAKSPQDVRVSDLDMQCEAGFWNFTSKDEPDARAAAMRGRCRAGPKERARLGWHRRRVWPGDAARLVYPDSPRTRKTLLPTAATRILPFT